MRLSEYIKQPGQSALALAGRCGVAASTITRAARGEINPKLKLLRRLAAETDGMVTPNDFLSDAAE